jgi:flagellar hook-basal body complex protein FliE
MISAITPTTNMLPTNIVNGLQSLGKSEPSGKSFADFMQESVSEKIQVLNRFESATAASTKGQISELELIKAVNEADIQLHAFKTVWEKFLQKYETIIEKTNI